MATSFRKENHLYLSHSSRAAWKSCKQLFSLDKFYNHPRREQSVPGALGNALHEGFQKWLVTGDTEQAILAYMLRYPIDLCQNPLDRYSIETGLSTLESIIEYGEFQQFKLATINCMDGVERPAVEVPFEIELVGTEIVVDSKPYTVSFIGFIDEVLRDLKTDDFIGDDLKTTGSRPGDYSARYKFNEQLVPYGLVVEHMKQLTKRVEKFDVRYLHATIDLTDPQCNVYRFTKTSDDINRWYQQLLIDINEIGMYAKLGWFPRDFTASSCMKYGTKKCKYYDGICPAEKKETAQMLLESEFKKELGWFPDSDLVTKSGHEIKEFQPWVKFQLITHKERVEQVA
jgi:hypothetical protein